jgi:hypothetical protein
VVFEDSALRTKGRRVSAKITRIIFRFYEESDEITGDRGALRAASSSGGGDRDRPLASRRGGSGDELEAGPDERRTAGLSYGDT